MAPSYEEWDKELTDLKNSSIDMAQSSEPE